jgi:hypothetical protein
LSGYGVSDALSDPQMTLYKSAVTIDTNDNWSSATNAPAIAAAATQSGGFPLPSGSRDAAMLVNLSSGNYTVIASGVGGATGTALVELYVVR